MRKHLLSALFSFCWLWAGAQTRERLVVNESIPAREAGTSYLYVEGVRLMPGFTWTAADGNFHIKPATSTVSKPDPSPDQNYIRTEAILVPGATNDAQADNLSVGSERQVAFQYFDGVGRPLQSSMVAASPLGRDLVQPHAYDALGREDKNYLPYTNPSNGGAFRQNPVAAQASFYNNPPAKVAADGKPYTQHAFESSPFSRITSSVGPGADWHDNNKSASQQVRINDTSTVRLWFMENDLPKSTAFYPAATLTIAESSDEEDRSVRVYTDFAGKTILRQVQKGTGWLHTYYVYNDYDQLVFVIPPLASGQYSPTQAYADTWYEQYAYDDRHRPTGSKAPGAGWIYTLYDQWDRPVLSQDANQRAKSPAEWSFIKYDDWNRPVLSGAFTTTATRQTLTQQAAATSNGRYESRNTSSVGYTLAHTFPTSITEANLLSVQYFDDYSFLGNAGWDAEGHGYSFVQEAGHTGAVFGQVKGLATGNKEKVLGQPERWLNSVTHYDNRYRPLQTVAEHLQGGVIRYTSEYNSFSGRLLKTLLVNTAGNVRIREWPGYDEGGRVISEHHQINDKAPVTLYALEYNELGEVVDKKLHVSGSDYLQSLDYRYTIRGWLKSINNAPLTSGADNDDADDLFGMELSYQDAPAALGATANYKGNLSASRWNHGSGEQGYRYQYDDQDRLQHARHYEKPDSWQLSDAYSERDISYDDHGNISGLTRRGEGADMDVLSYTYSGNQLTHVNDSGDKLKGFKDGSNDAVKYSYDANGNLTADKSSKISSISYNVLDKPETITFEDGRKLYFSYSASGQKLSMRYEQDNQQQWRYDYVGPFVYKDNTLQTIQHSQGRAIVHPDEYEYQYHITDHLGNVRLTFTSRAQSETLGEENQMLLATAGSQEASEEEAQFLKLDATRATVHPSVNHTAAGSPEVIRLNAGRGVKDGPGSMLKVMPGDTVKLKVYAKYLDLRKYDQKLSAAAILAMLATPAAGLAAVDGQLTGAASLHAGQAAGLTGLGKAEAKAAPKAYLNYLLFDKNMKQVDRGYKKVSEAAAIGAENIDSPHEELSLEVGITEQGYLFTYLSDEGQENMDVYFDDYSVELVQGPVVQIDDYYPYGMSFQQQASEHEVLNRYGYQGKS